MMKLALQPSILGGENEIPVATRAAVISPMRYCGVVSEDGIQCNVSFVLVAKVFSPRIDLFLSGRIPRHLAAKRISLALPVIRAFAHLGLECISLLVHVLASEVGHDGNKDGTLHLPEDRQIVCIP